MNGEFAIIIDFTLNGEKKEIVLDSVNDGNITSSLDVAKNPLVNGDITSDHIVKQPITYSFSGIISNKEIKSIVVDKSGVSLADVENLFETIQKEGILCNLVKVKINNDENSIPQFSIRQNMVLQSITWTEKINNISYSFNWNEIILCDVLDYSVDNTDENLPDVTEPELYNFTDTELLDEEEILKYFTKMLYDNDLMTEDFLDGLKSFGITAGVSLVASAVVAAVILAVSTVGASLIIGAIAVGVGILVYGIASLISWIKKTSTYKINTFKKYNDASKDEKERKRFVELLEAVHASLSGFNEVIKPYKFTNSGAQDCILVIDGEYYEFIITRNNDDNSYKLEVKKLDSESSLYSLPDIAASPMSLTSCRGNINNILKTVNSNYEVYVIRTGENKDMYDMRNYYIMVTSLPMSKYKETLEKLLYDFLIKK